MLSIQTNVNSLIAQQNLSVNNTFQSKTIQQLTSGYRINSSADDAAGLAVANQFRDNISELTQGVQNANNAVGTLQIIDGGLSNISQMLDRLKTLATESASGTFTGNRSTVNNEYQTLLGEIDRQATNINLNSANGSTAAGTFGDQSLDVHRRSIFGRFQRGGRRGSELGCGGYQRAGPERHQRDWRRSRLRRRQTAT